MSMTSLPACCPYAARHQMQPHCHLPSSCLPPHISSPYHCHTLLITHSASPHLPSSPALLLYLSSGLLRWQDVLCLSHSRSLTELSLDSTPFSTRDQAYRMTVLSNMPHLHHLDMIPVSVSRACNVHPTKVHIVGHGCDHLARGDLYV